MLPIDLRELEVISENDTLTWKGFQILHYDEVVLANILYPQAEDTKYLCEDTIRIAFKVLHILFRDIDNLLFLVLVYLFHNKLLVMSH